MKLEIITAEIHAFDDYKIAHRELGFIVRRDGYITALFPDWVVGDVVSGATDDLSHEQKLAEIKMLVLMKEIDDYETWSILSGLANESFYPFLHVDPTNVLMFVSDMFEAGFKAGEEWLLNARV